MNARSVRVLPAVVGLASFVLVGCPKTENATPDAGAPVTTASTAATPSAAPSASAAAAPAADAGAHAKHDMGNCPTSVAGADVAIKDVEGGVEVVITAKDEGATKDIRERAKKSLDADKADGGAGGHAQHNGQGGGGGATGRCTIVQRNTKLASAEVPGGAKITVLAKDAKEVDWLRRETRERDGEAKSKDAVGAGAKRMAHCPSAVEGAKTTVKDTKDGVIVTVTGPADKLAEIRDRAKHTADVAKKADSAKREHSGEGTGGGGVGRCPIVVEGDTSVELKEIATGVEATVTTKKDVAALQKEAKDRAANFK